MAANNETEGQRRRMGWRRAETVPGLSPDGKTLDVPCWCELTIVQVSVADVRRGVTGSCSARCGPGSPRFDTSRPNAVGKGCGRRKMRA